ncbi:DUF3093 domain-containing protein [Microlunatus sp. Y2014]|uniref:DUF3093 domain-containing protein n=1 Tax=Microlunatus sp. Y2014 TaxID=3418488 RepID=UPI003DA78EA4
MNRDYTELLWVPVHWWLLGVGFALSMVLAVTHFLGWGPGAVSGVAVMAVVAALFLSYGGLRIRVDDEGLHLGRGVLTWPYVASVAALDEAAGRDRMGPQADARALLVVRPYLPRVVEVTLDDPADPHPYWLVGSRRPELLAAAIRSHLPRTDQAHEEAVDAG